MAMISLKYGQIAIVDDEDYERLAQFRWYAARSKNIWYAQRGVRKPDGSWTTTTMHRCILAVPVGYQIDHRNGDGLDNRRSNLRLATHADNVRNQQLSKRNKSGFKGVSWFSPNGKWVAKIRVNGHLKHLGYFEAPEQAHAAYREASREFHGEFGRTE